MKKKLQQLQEAIERIFRCGNCGFRLSVIQTQQEAGKSPPPCRHCGGRNWIQVS